MRIGREATPRRRRRSPPWRGIIQRPLRCFSTVASRGSRTARMIRRCARMNRTRSRADGVVLLLLALMCALTGTSPARAGPATSSPQAAPQTGAETPAELNKKGSELIGQNRYDEAQAMFERALALARKRKDVREEAFALLGVGNAHYWKGEYAVVGGFEEKALALFESISDAEGLAVTFRGLGNLYDR